LQSFDRKLTYWLFTDSPLPETATAFWQMVWEHNVGVIVMVTGLVEGGRDKCFRYWPDPEPTFAATVCVVFIEKECHLILIVLLFFVFCSHAGGPVQMQFGGFRIELRRRDPKPGYTARVLRLHVPGAPSRDIAHLAFNSWPDHGVPNATAELLSMYWSSKEAQHATTLRGPMVVHCSAGVGRSGTFIALDWSVSVFITEDLWWCKYSHLMRFIGFCTQCSAGAGRWRCRAVCARCGIAAVPWCKRKRSTFLCTNSQWRRCSRSSQIDAYPAAKCRQEHCRLLFWPRQQQQPRHPRRG
jgi:hypothetical protein